MMVPGLVIALLLLLLAVICCWVCREYAPSANRIADLLVADPRHFEPEPVLTTPIRLLSPVPSVRSLFEGPEEFICPISLDVMKNPVIVDSGISYDSANALQIAECACTRIPIRLRIPNHLLAQQIKRGHVEENDFICPLSKKRITDPVVADDGVTYDRVALEVYKREQLEKCVITAVFCPNSNTHLANIVPNIAAKKQIAAFAASEALDKRLIESAAQVNDDAFQKEPICGAGVRAEAELYSSDTLQSDGEIVSLPRVRNQECAVKLATQGEDGRKNSFNPLHLFAPSQSEKDSEAMLPNLMPESRPETRVASPTVSVTDCALHSRPISPLGSGSSTELEDFIPPILRVARMKA